MGWLSKLVNASVAANATRAVQSAVQYVAQASFGHGLLEILRRVQERKTAG